MQKLVLAYFAAAQPLVLPRALISASTIYIWEPNVQYCGNKGNQEILQL